MTVATNLTRLPTELLETMFIESLSPYTSTVCMRFREVTNNPVFQRKFFEHFFRELPEQREKALTYIANSKKKRSLIDVLKHVSKEQRLTIFSLPRGNLFFLHNTHPKVDPAFYKLASAYARDQRIVRLGEAAGLLLDSEIEELSSVASTARKVVERISMKEPVIDELVLKGGTGNQISRIPEEFVGAQFVSMDFEYNNLTSVPEGLLSNPTLRVLSFYRNSIREIAPLAPNSVSLLTELDLRINKLTSIPDAVWSLKQLTILRISNNPIRIIPDQIGELTQLRELEAHDASLVQVSSKLGDLLHLSILELSFNSLKQVPNLESTSLTSLAVRSNELSTIPKAPLSLEKLHVQKNKITSVPESITRYTRLTSIDLANNKIAGITEQQRVFFDARETTLCGNPMEPSPVRAPITLETLYEPVLSRGNSTVLENIKYVVCLRFLF